MGVSELTQFFWFGVRYRNDCVGERDPATGEITRKDLALIFLPAHGRL